MPAGGKAAGRQAPSGVGGHWGPLPHEMVSSPSLEGCQLRSLDHLAGRLESPGNSEVYKFSPSSELL